MTKERLWGEALTSVFPSTFYDQIGKTRQSLSVGCGSRENSDPTYPTPQRTPVLAGYVQLC